MSTSQAAPGTKTTPSLLHVHLATQEARRQRSAEVGVQRLVTSGWNLNMLADVCWICVRPKICKKTLGGCCLIETDDETIAHGFLSVEETQHVQGPEPQTSLSWLHGWKWVELFVNWTVHFQLNSLNQVTSLLHAAAACGLSRLCARFIAEGPLGYKAYGRSDERTRNGKSHNDYLLYVL